MSDSASLNTGLGYCLNDAGSDHEGSDSSWKESGHNNVPGRPGKSKYTEPNTDTKLTLRKRALADTPQTLAASVNHTTANDCQQQIRTRKKLAIPTFKVNRPENDAVDVNTLLVKAPLSNRVNVLAISSSDTPSIVVLRDLRAKKDKAAKRLSEMDQEKADYLMEKSECQRSAKDVTAQIRLCSQKLESVRKEGSEAERHLEDALSSWEKVFQALSCIVASPSNAQHLQDWAVRSNTEAIINRLESTQKRQTKKQQLLRESFLEIERRLKAIEVDRTLLVQTHDHISSQYARMREVLGNAHTFDVLK